MATAIAHTGMAAASVQVQAAREYSSDNALVARIAAGDQTAMTLPLCPPPDLHLSMAPAHRS
jgi:Ni,Fe-hydrogenase I small subunit